MVFLIFIVILESKITFALYPKVVRETLTIKLGFVTIYLCSYFFWISITRTDRILEGLNCN